MILGGLSDAAVALGLVERPRSVNEAGKPISEGSLPLATTLPLLLGVDSALVGGNGDQQRAAP